MKLCTVETVRGLEQTAIDDWGIPADTLMQRAGRAAFDLLRHRWPEKPAMVVYCGVGNNGGDGWVVAAQAVSHGFRCGVVCDPERPPHSTIARRARQVFLNLGGSVTDLANNSASADTVVVDALLGIGSVDAPRGWVAAAIEQINDLALPVLALDCPSGLNADTGSTPGIAVEASATLSFIAAKRGLYTGRARHFTGDVSVDTLGLPLSVTAYGGGDAELLSLEALLRVLPRRSPTAHKGGTGHVLIIGGDHGMGGAVAMAAEAALRIGAGRVSVATQQRNISGLIARRPEIMGHAIKDAAALTPLLDNASALVLGPGLGQSSWSAALLQAASRRDLPSVWDADALNLLAQAEVSVNNRAILTPHPGEAARLLGVDTADIEADRYAAVSSLCETFKSGAVLKGAGTLIADAEAQRPTGVCGAGNSGMASGGMGDVLAGVIGGLLAQRLESSNAARLGVMLHSCAADEAATLGSAGLLASDLMAPLRKLRNGTVTG